LAVNEAVTLLDHGHEVAHLDDTVALDDSQAVVLDDPVRMLDDTLALADAVALDDSQAVVLDDPVRMLDDTLALADAVAIYYRQEAVAILDDALALDHGHHDESVELLGRPLYY